MEGFELSKKQSGINRFVGVSEEDEAVLLDHFRHKHENQAAGIKEWEKTPEVLSMIEKLNDTMAIFLRRYGIEAIRINPDAIHVLDVKNLSKEALEQIKHEILEGISSTGFHNSVKQGIGIIKIYDENKLSFWQTVVHEMLHMQGFYSYQKTDRDHSDFSFIVDDNEADYNLRRSGFSIGSSDGDYTYFNYLNEAVITELQIRFENEFASQFPELKEDLQLREEMMNSEAIQAEGGVEMASVVDVSPDGVFNYVSYSYVEERQELARLIDKLFEGNRDKFNDREEIFNLFAEATINGRILPVARLIETTLGKGKFRSIGEKSGS